MAKQFNHPIFEQNQRVHMATRIGAVKTVEVCANGWRNYTVAFEDGRTQIVEGGSLKALATGKKPYSAPVIERHVSARLIGFADAIAQAQAHERRALHMQSRSTSDKLGMQPAESGARWYEIARQIARTGRQYIYTPTLTLTFIS